MYSVLYLVVWLSLLGYGLGTPYGSFKSQKVVNAHVRSKRTLAGTPSLIDFEVRKAAVESAAEILNIKFCNDDHLEGVLCPGEEEADDPTCVGWRDVCNGEQTCGREEYQDCLAETEEQYGVQWIDYCAGDEKVDYCRLKDFQPIRCGVDIKLRKGATPTKIYSPNYNSDYPNNAFCFWRVTADEGDSIKVNFRDFFTEKNYDFLNIGKGHDYLSMDPDILVVNKLSGEGLPEPAAFKVSSNEIFVTFFADAYDNEKGFAIEVSVAEAGDGAQVLEPSTPDPDTDCGNSTVFELAEGEEVVITSPGFPETYNPNLQCDWRFKVAPGRRVGFLVKRMDTEYQADVISIGSGKNPGSDDNVVSRLEGNEVPGKPIIVGDSDAWLRFKSDSAIERTGFKIVVSESHTAECGGTYDVPEDGSVVIASPNYPHLAYRLNQNCLWSFKAAPGRTLTVRFLDFRTQIWSDKVSAGFDAEPAYDWSNYVIQEHSGRKLPEPPAFDTNKGAAWISFSSDSFIVDKGFKALVGDSQDFGSGVEAEAGETLELNQNCGEEISREEEMTEILITSPNYGRYYPPLLDCIWVINIPFGGDVKIMWDGFQTEPGRDYFTLGNGSDPSLESSIVIDRFSGTKPPKLRDAYFQSLWVRFQTDLKNHFRGWQFRILPIPYTECGGLIEVPEGGSFVIAAPGYPNYYPDGQTCRYTIQSTSGTRILFTITKFDVVYGDFLSVGEGCDPAEGGGIILDKQSVRKPQNYQFMPRTAAVWMKFHANRYRSGLGWMINLADSSVAVDEERGFGSCEPYTSDPTTDPPPVPTKKVILEPEGSGDVEEPKYQSPVDPAEPDWYDNYSEVVKEIPEEEEEEYEVVEYEVSPSEVLVEESEVHGPEGSGEGML